MLSILAKLREITQFWKTRLDLFYDYVGEEFDHDGAVNDRAKVILNVSNDMESSIEINELDHVMDENLKILQDVPRDNQIMFLAMNTEVNQYTVKHIRKVNQLQDLLKLDNVTNRQLEMFLDSTYDYFITVFNDIAQSIRDVKADKSLAEILEDELEDEKEAAVRYYDGLREYADMLNIHKKAEDSIRAYFEDLVSINSETIRKDILAILDQMDAELNAEKDAEQ